MIPVTRVAIAQFHELAVLVVMHMTVALHMTCSCLKRVPDSACTKLLLGNTKQDHSILR